MNIMIRFIINNYFKLFISFFNESYIIKLRIIIR